MKTRIVLFILTLVFAFSLASCGGSSPSSVVRSFYKYVENGDYEKAAALFTQSAINQYGIAKIVQIVQQQKEMLDSQGGVDKFNITNETIIKEQAMVQIKLTMGNGQELNDTINLVKEDGDWKIDMGK